MITYSTPFLYFFFFKFTFLLNILFIIVSTFLLLVNNFFGNVAPIKDKNISNFLKNLLIVNLVTNILVVSLLLYIIILNYKFFYLNLIIHGEKYNLLASHYNYYFYVFDFDVFNLIFYILSLFVAFISLLALDTRIYSSKSIFLVLCNVLVLVIFMFSFTNNYVLFFIFYELLLIPSFFFVYRISPAKTSIQSSIYFVMWTQIGSFLVFLAILFCIVLTNSYTFNSLSVFNFTSTEITIIQYLLFFGFGIKIPV
jgi:formate hydrogenlyase subunit 3/multisubunit Na+/H+ antiporter MnhD subunit